MSYSERPACRRETMWYGLCFCVVVSDCVCVCVCVSMCQCVTFRCHSSRPLAVHGDTLRSWSLYHGGTMSGISSHEGGIWGIHGRIAYWRAPRSGPSYMSRASHSSNSW